MRRTLGITAAAFLAGCLASGSSGGGNGNGFDTGLPPDEKISDLSQSDLVQACEETADALQNALDYDMRLRLQCTYQGLFVAALANRSESVCEETIDECLQLGGPDFDGDGEPDENLEDGLGMMDEIDCSMPEGAETCDAPVSDYEQCVGGQLREFEDFLEQINCSLVDDIDITQKEPDLPISEPDPKPPECEALEEQCPGILDD